MFVCRHDYAKPTRLIFIEHGGAHVEKEPFDMDLDVRTDPG